MMKYQIKYENNIIADISQKHFEYDTFITKYNENIDELMVLMVVLAIDSTYSSGEVKARAKNIYNENKPGFMKNI